MSRTNKYTVYRAGTEDSPSFGVTHDIDKVWLVTNLDLYYPLCLEVPTQSKVFLWKAEIDGKKGGLTITKHPTFEGVCVVEKSPGKSSAIKEVKKDLSSLYSWEKCSFERCRGGMSLINFNTLVHAVTVYMKENYPTTPEEFNFQAELKAASHWHWPKELVLGPHYDCRVITAAKQAITAWKKELNDIRKRQSTANSIDLEESIFELTNYFKKELDMEERDNVRVELPGEETSFDRDSGSFASENEANNKNDSGKKDKPPLRKGSAEFGKENFHALRQRWDEESICSVSA